ncbi:MAG: sodium:proton antiporter NhaD [Sphingobacteriales bacterium]|nr:sodium:proton antiporter NhaD [Sphingobacteriales bacterium]
MTILLILIFCLGYLVIAFEHSFKINKAATALLTATLTWSVYALGSSDKMQVTNNLTGHLGDISGILFFLLGAMVIVELIDAHDGFDLITRRIQTSNKKKLVWLVAIISFFLSAVLDNLTTTIVLISLLRKLIADRRERLIYAGLVIIAANAGGAWSPIGDVTTTMLWIGGQITAVNIIAKVLLPSLVSLLVPVLIISRQLRGNVSQRPEVLQNKNYTHSSRERNLVFWLGVGCLLLVPVFKTVTHLPPYMGILFGLGIMWVCTEMIHSKKDERDKGVLSVNRALQRIDTPSILFFLGILLCIAVLESTHVLHDLAGWLDRTIGNISAISITIGLLSAIVDNVPLVAGAQGMYSLEQFPADHYYWEFLAYCAGTGGSILIIGSAAGVAAMGLEKIDFFWYVKKIGWVALLGYLAGAAVFIGQQFLLN